ncbi:putative CAP domain-containing protein [Septoria linicola]|nr:putative CAP domain-containing protein [Septoria linicola]
MRSIILTAALLSNALATLAAIHGHSHRIGPHAQHRRREQDLDEAAKLRKREIYERNKEAAAKQEATNWIEPGYENQLYADECVQHHNVHRQNHLAYDMVWDDALAYTAQLVAQSCNYAHDTSYDYGQAGQNIAAGIAANNVSGCITELWYNAEYPYFSYNYGQPSPDYTYFESFGHMTQLVWKNTTRFGCATQYCPYGLANAGSVEPYFTVCNYMEAGNVMGMYDQNVSPPQGAADVHWDSF